MALWLWPFLIWGAAVISKNYDSSFHDFLRATRSIPEGKIWLAVRAVSVVEAATALSLLWSTGRRLGWYLTLGLATAFLILHGTSIVVGDTVPCGCLSAWVHFDGRASHVLMGLLCLSLIACSWLGVMGMTRSSSK